MAIAGLLVVLTAGIILEVQVEDPDAMRLDASLSPTTVRPGEALHVAMTVRNLLPLSNGPPIVDARPFGLWTGLCGDFVKYGVFQGRFTVENASMNAELNTKPCFIRGHPVLDGFCQSFRPDGSCQSLLRPTMKPFQELTQNEDFSGYYNVSASDYHSFSAGVYTVFVADHWGHVITFYFTVLSS